MLLEEPTIVAIEADEQKMVAAGLEARDMFGKVPDSIEVARPLRNGVIADYEITETLLQYLLQRVSGSKSTSVGVKVRTCGESGPRRLA